MASWLSVAAAQECTEIGNGLWWLLAIDPDEPDDADIIVVIRESRRECEATRSRSRNATSLRCACSEIDEGRGLREATREERREILRR